MVSFLNECKDNKLRNLELQERLNDSMIQNNKLELEMIFGRRRKRPSLSVEDCYGFEFSGEEWQLNANANKKHFKHSEFSFSVLKNEKRQNVE